MLGTLKKKNISLSSQGLKYKLKIAFYLMSILPLLACIYLIAHYIFPSVGLKVDILVVIMISVFIAVVGFFVIKEVFDRVLSISNEAKLIAAGDFERSLEISREDEIGELGDSLNQLTRRIRSNMNELKSYSERTTQINLEIQKRVIVLSSLLQVSSLISQGAKLDDILRLIIEKSRLLADSEVSYLMFREEDQEAFTMKVVDGFNMQYLSQLKIDPEGKLFSKLIKTNRQFLVDKENSLTPDMAEDFYGQFKLKNTLALPIYLRGKITGIVGIGSNKDNFNYRRDDIDLLDLFAKQIAIAVENDILIHRVEKLEIKDVLTGLYNELFIRNRLQEEIKRAINYQRPCAYILLNIDNFQEYHRNFGSLQAEATLKKTASLINDSVGEVDRVGRTGDNQFAIILPEKNKRQAQEVAESIRKKIEFIFGEEQDINKRLTLSGGVSENPLDGIDAATLIAKAEELLKAAKSQGKNRIATG